MPWLRRVSSSLEYISTQKIQNKDDGEYDQCALRHRALLGSTLLARSVKNFYKGRLTSGSAAQLTSTMPLGQLESTMEFGVDERVNGRLTSREV